MYYPCDVAEMHVIHSGQNYKKGFPDLHTTGQLCYDQKPDYTDQK